MGTVEAREENSHMQAFVLCAVLLEAEMEGVAVAA